MFKSLVNTLLPGNKPHNLEPYLEVHTSQSELNTPLRLTYSNQDATSELQSFLNAYLQASNCNINKGTVSSSDSNGINSNQSNEAIDLTVTFLTHGYMSHINKAGEYFQEIKDAILSHGVQPHVVVLLDWSSWSGSSLLDYAGSIKTVPKVATWLGTFVQRLRADYGTRVWIHGIGFSLGAHLMGNCAQQVDEISGGGDGSGNKAFNRITGLDPAGPGLVFKSGIFSLLNHNTTRLSKDHATFVDVIHTSDHLGTPAPLGHVDFYPNWGTTQSGIPNLGYLNVLSHIFCLKLFLDTILTENDAFKSTTHIRDLKSKIVDDIPDKAAKMGYFCEKDSRGSFYLDIGKII